VPFWTKLALVVTTGPAKLLEYLELGGWVMGPLAIEALVLWYCLGLRWRLLNRGNARSARVLVARYKKGYNRPPRGIIDTAVVWGLSLADQYQGKTLRHALDDAFGQFDTELSRCRAVINVVVVTAPLAGLLGTVLGMIETFDSLGEMALYTQTGGIAGGISQALFTTQMGLAVAVPGIIAGRALDRKETRFRDEIDQLKDLLCGAHDRAGHVVGSAAVPS
jgi:biopolymer transport protein ExbB